jgi:murein DD-endopeptidase MepM/ murein hydrolase activator NlpD
LIAQGASIGLAGRTGNASKVTDVPNAHLHLEVLSGGQKVNPEPYLSTQFDEKGNPKPNNNCK